MGLQKSETQCRRLLVFLSQRMQLASEVRQSRSMRSRMWAPALWKQLRKSLEYFRTYPSLEKLPSAQ
jgi:hypothetical protein